MSRPHRRTNRRPSGPSRRRRSPPCVPTFGDRQRVSVARGPPRRPAVEFGDHRTARCDLGLERSEADRLHALDVDVTAQFAQREETGDLGAHPALCRVEGDRAPRGEQPGSDTVNRCDHVACRGPDHPKCRLIPVGLRCVRHRLGEDALQRNWSSRRLDRGPTTSDHARRDEWEHVGHSCDVDVSQCTGSTSEDQGNDVENAVSACRLEGHRVEEERCPELVDPAIHAVDCDLLHSADHTNKLTTCHVLWLVRGSTFGMPDARAETLAAIGRRCRYSCDAIDDDDRR